MPRLSLLSAGLAGCFGLLVLCESLASAGDAIDRIKPEKLQAIRKDLVAFQAARQNLPRLTPYRDVRANLHVHSAFSHDSRGQIEDIVAAAKTVGTEVLMFTEHPADRYDFFQDGHQGLRDGVLLIPGAEMKGFLVYPTHSLRGLDGGSPQEFADLVQGRGGLMFLSHLEERMDWEIQGLTGCEIYNTHADFKDEKALIVSMKNPLWLLGAAENIRKYPQEAFSVLQDPPTDYLRRWDELCQRAPHTGVSANDAHQNVGIAVRLNENREAQAEDALGEKVATLDLKSNPALALVFKNAKPGELAFELRFDRYEYSLRHVSTHLLLDELSHKAVWAALEAGRAYVAFDWIADPRGFEFCVNEGTARHEMGSRLDHREGLRLAAQAPLPVHWKLIRSGKVIREADGPQLEFDIADPGNYRVEAWLNVGGKDLTWILSNPIYVR
ncbi:MAG: PHP domain-containing protein [Planctomycetes bacterium]|nr:PHP domain-containing protein [Planctomycetota bacterium]